VLGGLWQLRRGEAITSPERALARQGEEREGVGGTVLKTKFRWEFAPIFSLRYNLSKALRGF